MYMYMYTTKTDLTFFFCSFNNNWSLNFVQKEKGFTPSPLLRTPFKSTSAMGSFDTN